MPPGTRAVDICHQELAWKQELVWHFRGRGKERCNIHPPRSSVPGPLFRPSPNFSILKLFHYTEHPPVPLHGSTVFHLHAVSGGQVSMYNSLASQIFHPFGNLYRNVQQLLLDNILKIGGGEGGRQRQCQ